MINIKGLTKTYGSKAVVDQVSFEARPGMVTGFLGPNGAGKSTTLRMLVGLVRPTAGSATIGGRRYVDLPAPLRQVGVMLDAKDAHPGRRARDHLWVLACTHRIPRRRVDEVLELTGLAGVAGQRIGTYSLGMTQRLGIAAALLGDPAALVLDEPVNGLDPEGVVWLRTLVRSLAAEGRAVLVSSHLMGEMAMTADRVVVLGRGRLLADGPVSEVVSSASSATSPAIRVRTADPVRLAQALTAAGAVVAGVDPQTLEVEGARIEQIAEIAAAAGIPVYELAGVEPSLEDAFFALTAGAAEHTASLPAASLSVTPPTSLNREVLR